MPQDIFTNDKLLNKKSFSVLHDEHYGDGFFIDRKYQTSFKTLISIKRLNVFFFILCIFFLIIISRIFYLQIIKNDYYLAISEGNRIKKEIVPAVRGIFYDRFGNKLVENYPQFNLFIKKTADPEKTLENLSALFELNTQQIQDEINSETNTDSVLILENIDYDTALYIKSNTHLFPNIEIQTSFQRLYNYPYSTSHVLGYIGKISPEEWQTMKNQNYYYYDLIGKAGLEKQYEQELHGKPGILEKEVDANGNTIKILNYAQTSAGKNLTLTLDNNLNTLVYQELTKELKQINRTQAAAIALNPNSGEILALVSLPEYNNNLFSNSQENATAINDLLSDSNQPLFDRVISGEYPSGSTFKILMGLAGLQEGIITKSTKILSLGGIQIEHWFFPDWLGGGHGLTDIYKAIADSVNTYFYYVGGGYQDFPGLGLERIKKYAEKFYFNKLTGIDLPSEASGFLPSREWKAEVKNEAWYIGDTYHLSIGQGDLLVTPLQIAMLTSYVANGGTYYQPHLLKKINNRELPNKILAKDIIKPAYVKIIKDAMQYSVIDGSARSLSFLNFTSGAKTGTAQTGGDKDDHAWFTVFAPADNPQIVLTILIENGGEGSDTALSVAKNILNQYFNQK